MYKLKPAKSLQDKKENFCFAASNGDMTTIKQFLEEGLSANLIYEGKDYTTTPLESAIGGNQEEMMRFLIDNGADPDLKIGGAKPYVTCLAIPKVPYEKRLSMVEILYTKKPEMTEEIAEYVIRRLAYLGKNGLLDETINSEKSRAIIAKLEQINQFRLKREEDLKNLEKQAIERANQSRLKQEEDLRKQEEDSRKQEEDLKSLEKQTRETLGLNKSTGRNKSGGETKSGSSDEEIDPNHKNPASKIRPNASQSSPVVAVAANSGCVIS